MCIPPENEEPSIHFALLKKIASRNNLPELSMGMSNDYEDAIKFGATSVRIGSLFFGEKTSLIRVCALIYLTLFQDIFYYVYLDLFL